MKVRRLLPEEQKWSVAERLAREADRVLDSSKRSAACVLLVHEACTELLAGEVGERLVFGSVDPASDNRRQARELGGLICKSEAILNGLLRSANSRRPHAMP